MARKKRLRAAKGTKLKNVRGRPSLFTDLLAEKIATLAAQGATDSQIAQAVGISERVLGYWKKQHNDFLQSLKDGKSVADTMVEASLFLRAIGYSHEAVKIFIDRDGNPVEVPYTEHYPPDPTAMIFWLKNRNPDRWREKPPEPKPDESTQQTEIVYETEWGGTGEPIFAGQGLNESGDGEG